MHFKQWPVALLAGMMAIPAGAAAQCPDGQIGGPAMQGRCCWPGQSFSSSLGRCTGAPQCPVGMSADGESCVASEANVWEPPPATDAPVALTPVVSVSSWPLVSPDIGVGVVNPRTVQTGADMGLVIAGAITLGTGYVASILAGVFDEAGRNCSWGSCGSWWLGFVPLAGGVLAGTVGFSGYRYSVAWAFAMGIPAAVAQSLGLTLLLVGLLVDHEELVPSMQSGNILILPYASADAAGVSLTMEL